MGGIRMAASNLKTASGRGGGGGGGGGGVATSRAERTLLPF
jgi:hypothetical protein